MSTTRLPRSAGASVWTFTCGTPAKCTRWPNFGEKVHTPSPFGGVPTLVPLFWPWSMYVPRLSLVVSLRESRGGQCFSARHFPSLDSSAILGSLPMVFLAGAPFRKWS